MDYEEPRTWKQKGGALLGWAAVIIGGGGLALYTFFSSMTLRLYRDAGDAPSAKGVALQQWSGAIDEARRLSHATLISQNLPALSVAVAVNGDLVWSEAYGWADLDTRVAATPDTRFRLGHASTPLTSAAAGLLLEKKALNLDADIRTYVPAFPEKQWPVLLRHVMSHTGGVRHYRNEADYMPTMHCESAAEGLPLFANDPLRNQPETVYSYSTFGWILVSAAIEAAAQQDFYTFMRTRIFEPLRMRDTTGDSVKDATNQAAFYYPRLSGDTEFGPEPAAAVDYSCFTGAGGLVSTPSDLARFGIAFNSGKIVKPETVKLLLARQQYVTGDETNAGLGWNIETVGFDGEPTLLASAASRTLLGGAVSYLLFPEHGIVVAVMSNISYAQLRGPAFRIAEVFAQPRGTK